MLTKFFPTFGIPNIKKFYWLTLFTNSWFILSNWAFFFALYISREQIGIVDGTAIFLSLIMEVPTGAIADLLGKRVTLIAAAGCTILCIAIIVFAQPGFTTFLVGNIMMFIGFALSSGSREALGYDSLAEVGQEDKYDKVVTGAHTIGVVMTVATTLIGGFLYGLNPRFPWLAWLVTQVLAIVVLLSMTEPKIDSEKFSLKNYIKQNKEGVKHLFNKNLRPVLIFLLPLVLVLEIATGIFRQGIAADFGFGGDTFGYLLAVISAVLVFGTIFFAKLKKFLGEDVFSVGLLLAYILGFSIAYLSRDSNLFVGAGVLFLLAFARNFSQPLISAIVNKRIESKFRATTISVLTLLSRLPYILLAIFFGELTAKNNIQHYYLTMGGAIAIVVVGIVGVHIFRRRRV